MATIDLNNLIQPKKVNSTTTIVNQQVQKVDPVYVDLHLDLTLEQNIGLGINTSKTRDILVDIDIQAIKNSISNIFNTRKGQKILSPEFGCSLEQYLFEPVSELGAKAIGGTINDAIVKFEPRVDIIKVYVNTNPTNTINVNFNGKTLTSYLPFINTRDIGQGYAVTVIYKFKDIPKQDLITIFAQIGGQILI